MVITYFNCVSVITRLLSGGPGPVVTLTQLKYVITIADTGSMNEAAKLLFISQPSLSLALKELENEIGTELFKRSNRGVVLTPEGQEFLGYARQVTEQYKLMESRYIEKKNEMCIRDRLKTS